LVSRDSEFHLELLVTQASPSLLLMLIALLGATTCAAIAQGIDIPVDASAADGRGELRIKGVTRGVSIAPNGRVWLTTYEGESFRADRIDGDWEAGALRANGDGRFGRTIAQVSYFNDDTAIATGYLYRDPLRYYLLRTTDGGDSWQSIETPLGWVYDVQTTEHGEAWLGGSDGDFKCSSDFGATWRARMPPFGPFARTYSIAMIDGRRGYVGALHDSLARTDDSGRTWRALPTPSTQGLIDRPRSWVRSTELDMRISLALCGRYLLADQGGEVFVADTATFAWRRMTDLGRITRSPSASIAFGITCDGFVTRIDSALNVEIISDEPIVTPIQSLTASLDEVYASDWSNGLYHVRDGSTTYAFPIRGDDDAFTIEALAGTGRVLWGTSEHYLYRSDDDGDHWQRIEHQPIARTPYAGITAICDDIVLIHHRDSGLTRYDHRSRTFTRCDLDSIEVVDIVRRGDWWLAVGRRLIPIVVATIENDTIVDVRVEWDWLNYAGYLFRTRDGLEWERILAADSSEIGAIFCRGQDSFVVVGDRMRATLALDVPKPGPVNWESLPTDSVQGSLSSDDATWRVDTDGYWLPNFDTTYGALLYRAPAPPRSSMFRSPYAIERFRSMGSSHIIATESQVYFVESDNARVLYSAGDNEHIRTVEVIGGNRVVVGVRDFDSEFYGTFWEELDLRR
jgi:hypothetical protein